MKLTLRAARVNAGYTQKTAANLVGVTKGVICYWERGISFPNVKYIPKIEEVYNVKYEDIIFLPPNNALSVNELV